MTEEAYARNESVYPGSLNLRVVAEEVEEETQLELLRAQACQLIQGYFIGRTLPVAEFASFAAQCNSASHDPERPPAGAASAGT